MRDPGLEIKSEYLKMFGVHCRFMVIHQVELIW
jgi:hypothetical protein